MNTRLVVSLSGLDTSGLDPSGPERELRLCEWFTAELDRRGVPLSLLLRPTSVRPNPSAVVGWARERLSGGDALALHGFEGGPGYAANRLAARAVSTIRRSEPSTLPAHEAGLRLIAVLAAFERFGMRPDTFASPYRPVPAGTVSALSRAGFTVCADVNGVRELAGGRVYRGRTHSAGVHPLGATRADQWRHRRMLTGVGRAVRSGEVVRIAARAADLAVPERAGTVLGAVDLALGHGARAVTYRELATVPARRAAVPAPRTRNGTNLDPLTS